MRHLGQSMDPNALLAHARRGAVLAERARVAAVGGREVGRRADGTGGAVVRAAGEVARGDVAGPRRPLPGAAAPLELVLLIDHDIGAGVIEEGAIGEKRVATGEPVDGRAPRCGVARKSGRGEI